jgi:hypothetical protein
LGAVPGCFRSFSAWPILEFTFRYKVNLLPEQLWVGIQRRSRV